MYILSLITVWIQIRLKTYASLTTSTSAVFAAYFFDSMIFCTSLKARSLFQPIFRLFLRRLFILVRLLGDRHFVTRTKKELTYRLVTAEIDPLLQLLLDGYKKALL